MGLSAGAYKRMMAALLPPGRLWRLIGESVLASLLEACGDELARLDARGTDLLNEADPTTANELLEEYEAELDLDGTGTDAERLARVVSRLIARQRFRPVDFQTALAGLLGQDPEDVVVIERTNAEAVAMGDPREIFRFFIYRDPDLPGSYFLTSAQELVDAIKPSHTVGHVVESIDFLCDDPYSLCDRDILGA
jgi:uncharacterized protein YmfQ (DUF2313 family)